jgi:hypothetical protein
VGYRDPALSTTFSLGDYIPEVKHRETAPYRVIGSAYTATFSDIITTERTAQDPTGQCKGCHSFTTGVTGQRFSADAVAKAPTANNPQIPDLKEEIQAFQQTSSRRTQWATTQGAGKIHPWMVPGDGNDLSGSPAGMTDVDWAKFSNCLWGNGSRECGYKQVYTSCVNPESTITDATRLADPAGPTSIAVQASAPPSGESTVKQSIIVSWKYLNSLGGVPTRDDVRFNVAIKETNIPTGAPAPATADYPTVEQAKGLTATVIQGDVSRVDDVILFSNTSYAGHLKWTDPAPSTVARDFKVQVPASCNKRYLVRILPKRLCFDQSNEAFSTVDHTSFVDVTCAP